MTFSFPILRLQLTPPPISLCRLGMGGFPSQSTDKGSLETKVGWISPFADLQWLFGLLIY